MVCSTILAITLSVLCTFLIRGKLHSENENPIMRCYGYLQPCCVGAEPQIITLSAAMALLIGALYTATTIGSEFMPPSMKNGAVHAITDPRISLTEATRIFANRT